MVFQLIAEFNPLLSYMVHPTKSLANVGLAQARPNYTKSFVIQTHKINKRSQKRDKIYQTLLL